MSYTFKTKIVNKGNYGGIRNLSDIKYIVIHYTANDGDTDENNANYFTNNVVKVSAHYFVDDDSVTQCVPDNYVAWHCGVSKGYSYKHKECRNANSIGIEICDDVKNGVIYPSAKTIENAIELTKKLMKQYNVPQERVIRHYDVTGKLCPAYWSGTTEKNNKWKTEFWDKLVAQPSQSTTTTKPATTTKPTTQPTTNTYKSGSKITLSSTPVYISATATKIASHKSGTYYLWDNKVTNGRIRITNSTANVGKSGQVTGWVKVADIKIASSTSNTTVSKPATPTIKVGSTVKIKNGAKTYEGKKLASFVYKRNLKVKQINGDRVVVTYLGVVICAVKKSNLIFVK